MITNTNSSFITGLTGGKVATGQKLTGQNIPSTTGLTPEQTRNERIAKLGFKEYIRELQMEKLKEEARAKALKSLNLTEEKLEKIGAVSTEKYNEINQNIQDFISEYLTKEAFAQMQKQAQEEGRAGYDRGMLVDFSA